MKAICISASNVVKSQRQSTSYRICESIRDLLAQKNVDCQILDLRSYSLTPCVDCCHCFNERKCVLDAHFNTLYAALAQADCVFFVSPRYAPIPSKLSMLLEKMGQLTFLRWQSDRAFKSAMHGIPAGIISHGGGTGWEMTGYKAMVNDVIANALLTIQVKTVPFDENWDTGLVLPVAKVIQCEGVSPLQECDWDDITVNLNRYVDTVLDEAANSQKERYNRS